MAESCLPRSRSSRRHPISLCAPRLPPPSSPKQPSANRPHHPRSAESSRLPGKPSPKETSHDSIRVKEEGLREGVGEAALAPSVLLGVADLWPFCSTTRLRLTCTHVMPPPLRVGGGGTCSRTTKSRGNIPKLWDSELSSESACV